MKKTILLIIPLFVGLYTWGQNQAIKQVQSETFKKLIGKSSGTLLDVRTLNEYKNGHLKDAGQLNYYAIDFKKKLLMLQKEQPIFVYCNTGYRSKKTAEILIKNGYKNVYNLEHGILEWNLKSLPVEIESDAKPFTKNKMKMDEFKALINSQQLVFIDFYAQWCAPCREMMPMIDSMKTKYENKITIAKINADASKTLLKKLGIITVPYFALYYNGNLLFSQNGLITEDNLVTVFETNIAKHTNNQPINK